MAASLRSSTQEATPSTGSTTQLEQEDERPTIVVPAGTLRLRGEPAEHRRIRWAEDVIDNEGMGKKTSKGESSSEDDSDSSSSSDSESGTEPDNSTARMGGKGRKRRHHHHDRHHDDGIGGSRPKDGDARGKRKEGGRRGSPNAYERMPKSSGSTVTKSKTRLMEHVICPAQAPRPYTATLILTLKELQLDQRFWAQWVRQSFARSLTSARELQIGSQLAAGAGTERFLLPGPVGILLCDAASGFHTSSINGNEDPTSVDTLLAYPPVHYQKQPLDLAELYPCSER
ncbi:MAG: hypothetical protein M1830_002461 [Pleopsidium flavum]|nr:MAG: hypothetical protein M1830_002461 [Pleopsidium flavum]